LDALHKAVFSNASSQANVRQIRGRVAGAMSDAAPKERGGLSQLSVRGWTRSKAARNPDGGIESLIAFLEKKATPSDPNAAANQRVKISKVCGTSPPGGHRHIRSITCQACSRLKQYFRTKIGTTQSCRNFRWVTAASRLLSLANVN
jgi:hypothetical protein